MKKKPAPKRRKKPVSRLAARRRKAPPAGAVVAGPVSWTPPAYLPHQRVRIYEHLPVMHGTSADGRPTLVRWPDKPRCEAHPDHWTARWSERIALLRRQGRQLIAVGHEGGVMVAHFGPAGGNA